MKNEVISVAVTQKWSSSLHSTSSQKKAALNNRLRSEQSSPVIRSVSFTDCLCLIKTRIKLTFGKYICLVDYFTLHSWQNPPGPEEESPTRNLNTKGREALDRLKKTTSMTLKNHMNQNGRILLFITCVWIWNIGEFPDFVANYWLCGEHNTYADWYVESRYDMSSSNLHPLLAPTSSHTLPWLAGTGAGGLSCDINLYLDCCPLPRGRCVPCRIVKSSHPAYSCPVNCQLSTLNRIKAKI